MPPVIRFNNAGQLKRVIDRTRAERSLYEFSKQAWNILEPDVVFRDAWFLRGIAEHLEAQTRKEIMRLALALPPSCMKSRLIAVNWPAWSWIDHPEARFFYASYSQDLSTRDSLYTRMLIESDWYQENWGKRFQLSKDDNRKTFFRNDKGGWRLSSSVSGRGTGEHPDHIIGDDLHNVKEAESNLERQAALDYWNKTLSSRGIARGSTRTLAGQRLHANDVIGDVLKEGGYELICLPMFYEVEHPFPSDTSLGFKDIRTEEGELLWPELLGKDAVNELRRRLKVSAAAQLQQRPNVAGGTVFQQHDFRYCTEETLEVDGKKLRAFVMEEDGAKRWVPLSRCWWFQTVDTALKKGEENDYTVIGTFCITPKPVRMIVYDIFKGKVEVPYQYNTIIEQRKKHRRVLKVFIEDKQSGTGLIQQGRLQGIPFVPLKAKGSKEQRAAVSSTMYHDGLVYHLSGALWLADLEEELTTFPNSSHDDQVDVVGYAGIISQSRAYKQQSSERSFVYAPGEDKAEQPKPSNGKSLAELLTGRKPGSASPDRPGF